MSIIATCPQCDTKFSIAAAVLGAEGKTVRCSKCQHKWFQTPPEPEAEEEPVVEDEIAEEPEVEVEEEAESNSEEEIAAEEPAEEASAESLEEETAAENPAEADAPEEAPVEEAPEDDLEEAAEEVTEIEATDTDFDDIPDSVKPVDGEEAVDVTSSQKTGPLSKSSLIGYGSALAVLVLIIVITILLRPVFVNASLTANAYYGLFGFSPQIEGKEIAFNGVEAKIEDGVVTVSGTLLNLGKKEAHVPYMVVRQLDSRNRTVKNIMIEPPVKSLKADAAHAFSATIPADEKAESVKISFTLKKPEGDHADDHAAKTKSNPEQSHPTEDHHKSPAH